MVVEVKGTPKEVSFFSVQSLPTLKLAGRVKTMSYEPKNWYAVTFWVKLNGGV